MADIEALMQGCGDAAEPPDWAAVNATGRQARSRPVAWALRSLKVAALSLFLTAGSIGGYWGVLQYLGNVHEVAPGALYRSAQLSKAEFRTVAETYGIKSVLNLRGAHVGRGWYDQEIEAANQLHLAHYDYPLSAKRFVTEQQIADLLDIIRRAPKPLLVHCQSGADRAGLVSALYRYAIAGASAEEADRQLTLLYGHFPYLTSRSVAMDDSFWAFVRNGGKHAAN